MAQQMQSDPRIRPGELKRRVTLLTPATTQDTAGGPAADVAGETTWASISGVYGQNLYQGQFVSQSTHLIVMRYRAGIVPSMRIQYGTRTFNILFIDNVQEQNTKLNLMCEEVL
jgi:SPP1 family predicted phage head-tail adaptor